MGPNQLRGRLDPGASPYLWVARAALSVEVTRYPPKRVDLVHLTYTLPEPEQKGRESSNTVF